jgi:hypothetical protein
MGQNSLKVYICGAGGAPTNPNSLQNADPGGCGTGATYAARITAYTITGTFTDGGVDYNIYHPVIPDVSGLLVRIGLDGVAQCDPAWFAAHPRGWVAVCMSWDFTGNVVWPTWGRMLDDNPGQAATNFYDWQAISVGVYGDSMSPATSPIYRGGQGEYMSYSFAAPAAYGMPSNVFVHVTGYPGV